MPQTAAAIGEARRLFGPQVDCLGAVEGLEVYRDPQAFAKLWDDANGQHELYEQARRTLPRGTKSDGFVHVPGDHKRVRRL